MHQTQGPPSAYTIGGDFNIGLHSNLQMSDLTPLSEWMQSLGLSLTQPTSNGPKSHLTLVAKARHASTMHSIQRTHVAYCTQPSILEKHQTLTLIIAQSASPSNSPTAEDS
jgi:hypothetical protein